MQMFKLSSVDSGPGAPTTAIQCIEAMFSRMRSKEDFPIAINLL
jgi:hypothetical protein